MPTHGTVNIHPSRLPQYCGALPTLWSLKNGDRESAVTYLVMEKEIDAGAVIAQHPFSINEDDDWYSLEMKFNEILRSTLPSDLAAFAAGKLSPKKQEAINISSTSGYYPYMKIDWHSETARDIYNKINLYPFLMPNDYCHAVLGNRKIIVKKANLVEGRRLSTDPGHFQVQPKPNRFYRQKYSAAVIINRGEPESFIRNSEVSLLNFLSKKRPTRAGPRPNL